MVGFKVLPTTCIWDSKGCILVGSIRNCPYGQSALDASIPQGLLDDHSHVFLSWIGVCWWLKVHILIEDLYQISSGGTPYRGQ